jgi:hypothetical protein
VIAPRALCRILLDSFAIPAPASLRTQGHPHKSALARLGAVAPHLLNSSALARAPRRAMALAAIDATARANEECV